MRKSIVIIYTCCIFGTAATLAIFEMGDQSIQKEIERRQDKEIVKRELKPASVFQEEYYARFTNSLPENEEDVVLIAVGDIMLSRDVDTKMKRHGYSYPFLETRNFLQTGDIIFGNLETAVTPGRKIGTNEMVFRADPEVVDELAESNFNIFSLANNHSMNFGINGINDTMEYLSKAGIFYSGAGSDAAAAYAPTYVEARGIKFAFLAYESPSIVPWSYEADEDRAGIAFTNIQKMASAVKKANAEADIVIVSMHAGVEYVQLPNSEQREFARAAIDAGADMVIGHHPHVTQTVEKYKGKYIFYSLGNFIFDQMWSLETRRGLMIKAHFDREEVKEKKLYPVMIDDYAKPRIVEDRNKEAVLERLGIEVEIDPDNGVAAIK